MYFSMKNTLKNYRNRTPKHTDKMNSNVRNSTTFLVTSSRQKPQPQNPPPAQDAAVATDNPST